MPCEGIGCGCKSRPGPMSYKNKKLKKSKFNYLKFKFGLIKLALLKRARALFLKVGSNRERWWMSTESQTKKRGGQVFGIEKAVAILKRYDRMNNNSDSFFLKKVIIDQIQKEGFLRLCVFVCPKFNTDALLSETPEKYMPIEAGPDLFEPRIAKILSLRKDLMRAGLPTEINLLIGDNDAEEYIFPFLPLLSINTLLYRQRQTIYRRSFEERCRNIFGSGRPGCLVWSLGESRVIMDSVEPVIAVDNMQKELKFFDWLFSKEGPYKDRLKFSDEVLVEMVKRKYALYGAQGKFLEILGGILLQTEGPCVWLERTNMLKSTGSPAIPAIYPWIRKDEVQE